MNHAFTKAEIVGCRYVAASIGCQIQFKHTLKQQ